MTNIKHIIEKIETVDLKDENAIELLENILAKQCLSESLGFLNPPLLQAARR